MPMGHTGEGKEAGTKEPHEQEEPGERRCLCFGSYVFPNFEALVVAMPSLINNLCSQV